MAIAHAAMTAEGDNRVLTQKVVKDMIKNIASKKSVLPKTDLNLQQLGSMPDVTQIEQLYDLLKFLESQHFVELSQALEESKTAKKAFFTAFFLEQQVRVQKLSELYAERHAFESTLKAIQKLVNAENKRILNVILRIYAIDIIRRELGFLMIHGAVSAQASAGLEETYNKLIKDLSAVAP